MRIFISWSKDLSRQHAEAFRNWVPHVIQSVEPFISAQDISLGERGVEEIEDHLKYNLGVLFVTRENMQEPWLLYEAGALSRSVGEAENRVIPILIDIEISDLAGSPLSHFQNADSFSKTAIKKVCASINELCKKPLKAEILDKSIDNNWPDLSKVIKKISVPEKPNEEITLDSIADQIDELTDEIISLRNNVQSNSLFIAPNNAQQFIPLSLKTQTLGEYSVQIDDRDSKFLSLSNEALLNDILKSAPGSELKLSGDFGDFKITFGEGGNLDLNADDISLNIGEQSDEDD